MSRRRSRFYLQIGLLVVWCALCSFRFLGCGEKRPEVPARGPGNINPDPCPGCPPPKASELGEGGDAATSALIASARAMVQSAMAMGLSDEAILAMVPPEYAGQVMDMLKARPKPVPAAMAVPAGNEPISTTPKNTTTQ